MCLCQSFEMESISTKWIHCLNADRALINYTELWSFTPMCHETTPCLNYVFQVQINILVIEVFIDFSLIRDINNIFPQPSEREIFAQRPFIYEETQAQREEIFNQFKIKLLVRDRPHPLSILPCCLFKARKTTLPKMKAH